MTSTYFIPAKKLILMLLLWWMVAPCAFGEGADQSKKRATRLYEASGRYYEEQLYDSAVIVGALAIAPSAASIWCSRGSAFTSDTNAHFIASCCCCLSGVVAIRAMATTAIIPINIRNFFISLSYTYLMRGCVGRAASDAPRVR